MLTLINSTYGTVKGYRRGSLVTLRIDWNSSAPGAWNTGNFGTLPESWRPPMDLNFSYGGRDGANPTSHLSTNSTLIDSICIAPNLGATCNRHADS